MENTNYIAVHKYAKLKNTSIQNVYRWLRENKFSDDDFIIEEVVVKRIRIKENAEKK